MTRTHKLLDFYASKAWAMPEANLQDMYEIYKTALERKEVGGYLDPEAVLAKTGKPLDNTRNVTVRDGVAVIPVSGPIFRRANLFTEISGATSIEVLAKDIQQARDDRTVRAILLEINSPGGEADGTSELAQLLYEMRDEKRLVAYIAHVGASAAYWLASATEEIVIEKSASAGAIGVVASVSVHKDKNRLEFVSSQSPNKRPNPETESGRSQIQTWLDDLGQVFIDTVARNRDLTADQVIEQGGQGGLRVGQKAVDAGLADRLGTLEGVIAELSTTDLATWKPKRKNVSSNSMLDNSAKSDEGDLDMADQKPEQETKTDAADLDKKIETGVAGFFKRMFSGSESASAENLSKPDERVDAHATEIEKLKTETDAAKKEAAEAKAQVALLQKNDRANRFSALAKDWPGETAKHVAMLELLATSQASGEDSTEFKDHVTHMNAIAAQAKTSDLFKEIGSTQPAEGSITARVESDIQKLIAADPKMTYAIAFDQVRSALPASQRVEYDNEQRRTVN